MLLTLSDNVKNPIEEIEISRDFNKEEYTKIYKNQSINIINIYEKIYYAYWMK